MDIVSIFVAFAGKSLYSVAIKTYEELAQTLPYLNDPQVFRSCVERDSNADIMAVIRLDDESCLQPYLTHPLHMQMAQDMKDVVIGRTSFDHT